MSCFGAGKNGRWAEGGKSRPPTCPDTRVTQQSLGQSGGGVLDKTTAQGHQKCLQELPVGCQLYICKCKANRGKERACPSPFWGSIWSGVSMYSVYCSFSLLEISAVSRISTGSYSHSRGTDSGSSLSLITGCHTLWVLLWMVHIAPFPTMWKACRRDPSCWQKWGSAPFLTSADRTHP